VPYKLKFSASAARTLSDLEGGDPNDQRKPRKVRRALGRLEQIPRHPGLASHPYESLPLDRNIKVWDSYVENNTPSAWRIFWRYGPDEPGQSVITVLAIGPHA
jgi:hypothetical protein